MMSAVELYGEKREKKGREEAKKETKEELYEKLLKKGFDKKTAHDLVYED